MPHEAGFRRVQRVEDDLREKVRVLYLEQRDDLARLLVRQIEPEINEAQVKALGLKVAQWMTSWEVPVRATKRRAYALLEPEYRLKEMVEEVSRFKALLDAAVAAQELDPGTYGGNIITQYYRCWTDAKDRLTALEKEMGFAEEESLDAPAWKALRDKQFRRILRDYKGKGEIYRMLCRRLATLETALQRMEELGRMETAMYGEFQDRMTRVAEQLQKYTESTKIDVTETIVSDVGERFLKLIEPLLFNQPVLFDRICDTIEGNVVNIRDGKPLALPAPIEAA